MKIIFTLKDLLFLLAVSIILIWIGYIWFMELINRLKKAMNKAFGKNKR